MTNYFICTQDEYAESVIPDYSKDILISYNVHELWKYKSPLQFDAKIQAILKDAKKIYISDEFTSCDCGDCEIVKKIVSRAREQKIPTGVM